MYPVQPMAPPPNKSGGSVVLIVVLVIAGVLLVGGGILTVLAVYGVRRYVQNAKTVEGRSGVAVMAKDAVSAFESDAIGGKRRICPSARPVPVSFASVSGKKYQSSAAEWQSDPGWSCLRYERDTPQYFQYAYESTPASFSAFAKADLAGDHQVTSFELRGQLLGDRLVVSPQMLEQTP